MPNLKEQWRRKILRIGLLEKMNLREMVQERRKSREEGSMILRNSRRRLLGKLSRR